MAKARKRAKANEHVRLERGEGKERVFWQIMRRGTHITTTYGKYLSSGRTIEKELADEEHAERAYDKMIADKRAEGYGEPVKKAEPGAASVKGVSVRNAELEALIDADPDDAQGYLVYADWLQQQGDVRGELIVVQHQRSSGVDDMALDRAETALFAGFAEELVGPLEKFKRIRTPFRSERGLAWRYGFLHAARLRHSGDTSLALAVRTVLEHPSGRFLRRLVLSRPPYGREDEVDLPALFAVLAKIAPRTLDHLVIGDDGYAGSDLGGLWTAMPRLRRLALAGNSKSPKLGAVRADALEELVVTFASHDEIAAISGASWPALRRLSLVLTMPTATEAGALNPFFASKGMPSLAHLAVARWMTTPTGTLRTQDALALETLRYAATRKLERLDLQVPITEAGARAILDEPLVALIGSISIPTDALPSAAARGPLTARFRNIEWTSSYEQPDLELIEE